MNRMLIEAAELELSESAAWRALHVEFFRKVFNHGSNLGAEFDLVWERYFCWCKERDLWCSQFMLERQLDIAGYQRSAGRIQDVALLPREASRRRGRDDLDVERGRAFLGIPAGLLHALRECDSGPAWGRRGGKILYLKEALTKWRVSALSVSHRQQVTDARRCLAELCEFARIELRRQNPFAKGGEFYRHPRLLNASTIRRLARLSEWELFAAAKTWYRRETGWVPADLEECLRRRLESLGCRRIRQRKLGTRPYSWCGVWLKAPRGSCEATYVDRSKPYLPRRPS
jgi:hypothetical protein